MALAAMQQPTIILVTSRNSIATPAMRRMMNTEFSNGAICPVSRCSQMRLPRSFVSAGRKLGESGSRESQHFLPRTVAGSEKIGREESRLPNPLVIADDDPVATGVDSRRQNRIAQVLVPGQGEYLAR